MSKGLKNIGPKTERWLAAIGVHSREELERLGAVETYCRLLLAGFPISLVGLYALQGAIMNEHWNDIGEVTKAWLRDEVRARKTEDQRE